MVALVGICASLAMRSARPALTCERGCASRRAATMLGVLAKHQECQRGGATGWIVLPTERQSAQHGRGLVVVVSGLRQTGTRRRAAGR